MRSVASSLSVVVAVICAQHVAYAQYTTSATCSSSFDWAVNQQNYSPCLVAAYVQGACSANGIWDVPAMPNLQVFYQAPLTPATECGCSIANYNLLSACAACQGASPPRFPYWITNCSNAGLMDVSTYYPTSKWPIPDGVQIPLWAQEDARLWTNMQFNSTEAQQIATSGKLIGQTLGPSSTTSSTATSSSSLSNATSTSYESPTSDSHTEIGPIVGGVVGGVLGLLFIGVLIWWILRRRRPSFEDASASTSAMAFTASKGPTPPLLKMFVPVPQRPHLFYPSNISSPAPTSNSTGNMENSSVVLVQYAPGTLDHLGAVNSHPYTTVGAGPTFGPPSMTSSNEPQRMGSSSSRSMIARFVFPRRRNKRHSDAPSTLSQGSSRMSQIGILHSPPPNVRQLSQLSSTSPVPGQDTLEPTPFILPPPASGDSGSHSGMAKPRIYPPGYMSPEAAIPSPLSPSNSAVHAQMSQPVNTDINRMIVATPGPMPEPPSYLASQAESREEQLRRAASTATAGTHASSNNILPTPSTPERRGGPLAPVPERAVSPQESDYPQEKV